MSEPWVLDGCCGAGGAGTGYQRAGFRVLGVDNRPQPHYPFPMVQADILDVLAHWDLSRFALIHVSPPCQAYAEVANTRKRTDHPDLIGPVRDLLRATGKPYVVENVPPAPMPDAFVLCGSTFSLPLIRHRKFETYPPLGLVPSTCPQSAWLRGTGHPGAYPYGRKTWEPKWREIVIPQVWPWMTLEEAGEAIPPDYTEWIGRQMAALEVAP